MNSEPATAPEPARRRRAYRFALDPTTAQLDAFAQLAAARWVCSHCASSPR